MRQQRPYGRPLGGVRRPAPSGCLQPSDCERVSPFFDGSPLAVAVAVTVAVVPVVRMSVRARIGTAVVARRTVVWTIVASVGIPIVAATVPAEMSVVIAMVMIRPVTDSYVNTVATKTHRERTCRIGTRSRETHGCYRSQQTDRYETPLHHVSPCPSDVSVFSNSSVAPKSPAGPAITFTLQLACQTLFRSEKGCFSAAESHELAVGSVNCATRCHQSDFRRADL